MKNIVLIACIICSVSLGVLSSCASAERRKHGGYDSQTWVPKKHYDPNMRTFTGYPRSRRK